MNPKKYTLKKQGHVYALMADGHPQVCPFIPPTPVQTKLGGVQMMPAVCSSQCPHFHTYRETMQNGPSVKITCGCEPVVYHINDIETDKTIN